MNYKFHVGDYVCFTDGNSKHTGYVISYYNYPITNIHLFAFEFDDGTHFRWSGNINDLPRNITRIGAYDFTKKEKKKIEMISECNRSIFANTIKPENHIARMVSNDIIDKINELVNAVNKLMEDKDGRTDC